MSHSLWHASCRRTPCSSFRRRGTAPSLHCSCKAWKKQRVSLQEYDQTAATTVLKATKAAQRGFTRACGTQVCLVLALRHANGTTDEVRGQRDLIQPGWRLREVVQNGIRFPWKPWCCRRVQGKPSRHFETLRRHRVGGEELGWNARLDHLEGCIGHLRDLDLRLWPKLVHKPTCITPRADAFLREVKARLRAGTQLCRFVCERAVCPHFALVGQPELAHAGELHGLLLLGFRHGFQSRGAKCCRWNTTGNLTCKHSTDAEQYTAACESMPIPVVPFCAGRQRTMSYKIDLMLCIHPSTKLIICCLPMGKGGNIA